MKKVFFLMFALLLISAASVKSQVTMGSLDAPHPGAVLDLKNTDSSTLGLKLPLVALDADPAVFVLEGIEESDAAGKASASGMVVYNTADVQCGPGIYYWDGGKWNPTRGCPEPKICDIPELPGEIEFSESAVNLNGTFTASVPYVAGVTYTWSLPSGLTGSSPTNEIEITGEAAGIYAAGEISVTASNDCGTSEASSSITAVTVSEPFTQGNPAAASICNGATHTFTLAVATGGLGTITYNWQQSSDNSSWTDAAGTRDGQNYTTPSLSSSMYYRRQATAATYGGTISSASALVTVAPVLTQGNPSAATICNGATCAFTLAAASGGLGTITYQWQSSANNSIWANIAGATGASYTTPALTASTYYRQNATAATCGGTISSASALVTVAATFTQPNPAAATIISGKTHTFSLGAASGGLGTITYQWQSSANNSTWANIAGATGASYTTPALTANTYYRRNATAATCGGTISSASALVTITGPAGSIKVGSYYWAVTNLQGSGARGGTFVANVYDLGMHYQWNRSTGWPSTGTVTGWSNTYEGTAWVVGNDPCPAGYRVPTREQLADLRNQPNVWVVSSNPIAGLGGRAGRIFGPGASTTSFNSATQIFLPMAGARGDDGVLNTPVMAGTYWSSTASTGGLNNAAYSLDVTSGPTVEGSYYRPCGKSLRCVAE